MKFADLAFAERENADPSESQLLEESSNMFLGTGYTIESFGDD
jgi:hypothetical protein